MEAKLYKVTIYEGTLAYVHNMGHEIWEIFIPQIGAVVNECHGAFRQTEPRAKENLIDIDVPYEAVMKIDAFIRIKEESEKLIDDLFKDKRT